jgi:hypothetical protein
VLTSGVHSSNYPALTRRLYYPQQVLPLPEEQACVALGMQHQGCTSSLPKELRTGSARFMNRTKTVILLAGLIAPLLWVGQSLAGQTGLAIVLMLAALLSLAVHVWREGDRY